MAGLLDPFPASEPTGCGWWRLHQFQHCHGSGKDVTAPWEAQARYVAAHAVPARPRYGSHLPHCGSPHQCMATSHCPIECNPPYISLVGNPAASPPANNGAGQWSECRCRDKCFAARPVAQQQAAMLASVVVGRDSDGRL